MRHFLAAAATAATLHAQDSRTIREDLDLWFGTFSIIAFDPATHELGVGVKSRAFGAGAAVSDAKQDASRSQ